MHHKLKLLGFVFLLGSAAMLPLAKADEADQQTTVRLSAPVQVPGNRVLPAGEYVFKLADQPASRSIVQIFTADQSQLLATVFTVPTHRDEPASDTVITLEERPDGSPEAIGKWFYPGQTEGVEFLYLR